MKYSKNILIKNINLFDENATYRVFDPALRGIFSTIDIMTGEEILRKLDSMVEELGRHYRQPIVTQEGDLLLSYNGHVVAIKSIASNNITDIYTKGITIKDKHGVQLTAKLDKTDNALILTRSL